MVNFFKGRLSQARTSNPEDIARGEGAIVQLDSSKAAVYRDEDGRLHAMSPVCTHMKCIVDWNSTEKTWDCPCHGSRYDPYGHVINGPAKRNLPHRGLEE
jgi:Rieske Fe-S protein